MALPRRGRRASQFSREAFDQNRVGSTLLGKITDSMDYKTLAVSSVALRVIELLITIFVLALPILLPMPRMAKHR